MQLHELHPALVHFPIVLLPASLAADASGMDAAGRTGIVLTAATAALAATTGLVAQEEVEVDGKAHDLLATHRTLNLGVLGLTTAMALYRTTQKRVGLGYLAAGLLGLGVTAYSAYLGGRMVYGHGVGVEPAGGLAEDHAPPLGKARAGPLFYHVLRDLGRGVTHTLEHLREGEIVPTLTNARPAADGKVQAPSKATSSISPA